MKYYKSNNLLIQFNPETKIARIKNTIGKNKIISIDEFNSFEKTQIKKDEFSRLMNIFYKDIKHNWEYENQKYKKLPNFESKDYSLITNYDFNKLPKHDCGVYGKCLLVYHWGKIYYFTVSYNGYEQGQLLDIKTKSSVRWARAKHCAPILNITKNKII